MAATITISCPDCKKQMKAPAHLEGKKVRCKECGATFAVKAPAPARAAPEPKPAPAKDKVKPAKGGGKPAAPAKAAARRSVHDDPDDDNPNPYGVTDIDLAPRCPYCAHALDGEDAIICLNCGYNTETRERVATRKVFERTVTDWFLWLLPPILCVGTIILLITLDVFYFFKLKWEAAQNEWYWPIALYGIKLWVIITTLFIIFFCARSAIKRLVFHPVPPERTKPDERSILGIIGLVIGGLLLLLVSVFVLVMGVVFGGLLLIFAGIAGVSAGYGIVGAALSYDKR